MELFSWLWARQWSDEGQSLGADICVFLLSGAAPIFLSARVCKLLMQSAVVTMDGLKEMHTDRQTAPQTYYDDYSRDIGCRRLESP